MRVGWVDFNKEEEKLFNQAFFFGIFVGFTIGTILFLFSVLPTIPRRQPQNLWEWAHIIFILSSMLAASGLLTSIVFAYLKYRGGNKKDSIMLFRKTMVALFISFPVLLMYGAFVILLILIPFNDFFSQWLRPGILYPLGMLLVFPFFLLIIAVGLPDSKPGKSLRRFFRRLKRSI